MQILKTQEFIDNINTIKDFRLDAAVTARLMRVADGNLGDHKSVGGGISELRIHYGGYRIYYAMRGQEIVLLLCAGGKDTQKRDIKKAKELAKWI